MSLPEEQERIRDKQTTDEDVVVPLINGEVQEECTRDEFLLTLANLSDEERQNTTWSVIS
jgi:hypothetical protein